VQRAHQVLDPSQRSIAGNLCALAIMTKAPRAGQVKTRLVPPLTSEEAAELNAAFLRDLSMSILRACEMSPAGAVAVYTPPGSEAVYENILPREFMLVPQRGENFGERLIFAAEDLFTVGFASVCLINSDSPSVPPQNFAEAAIELAEPPDRVVLGPADDGGYYLIGLKRMRRRLFEEIDWSTERVFEQTKQRAAELGLRTHELALGLDVDDRASLASLSEQLLSNQSPPEIAPSTRKFLVELAKRKEL
jgi:rSAM/selenodomain-associated transferase 1